MCLNKPIDLLLFTISYPYDFAGEISFLKNETRYLSSKFNTHIIPLITKGNKEVLPQSVILEDGLSKFIIENKKSIVIKALFNAAISKWFYFELISKPYIIFNPKKFKKLVLFNYRSCLIFKWINFFIKKNGLNNERILFYTYWFTEATTALCKLAEKQKNIKIISRAHGIDIYEDQNEGYIPFRRMALSKINSLCLASNHAYNYASKKYKTFQEKFKVFGLGVKDPGFLSKKSEDNNIRIVSCSNIIAIKRIELLLDGMNEFAKHFKNFVYWYHIGDGSLKQKLLEKINKISSTNLKCLLVGNIKNDDVLHFYKANPVDIFISTSSTEGGRPLSIQEAQSCGIPVIGTNVGGIPEIVNSTNGILLSENPTPLEISDAIIKVTEDTEHMDTLRVNARTNWEKNFNEKTNFPLFINFLNSI